jgi:hypothetical protein
MRQNSIPEIFDQGGSQTRMIFVVDYEKGRLNIIVMNPKQHNKVTILFIDLNAMHPLDKMDLHRHTREMLNRGVMMENLGIKKLQVINEKLRNQL